MQERKRIFCCHSDPENGISYYRLGAGSNGSDADTDVWDGAENSRKSTHSQRPGNRRRAEKGSRSSRNLAGHRHRDPTQLRGGNAPDAEVAHPVAVAQQLALAGADADGEIAARRDRVLFPDAVTGQIILNPAVGGCAERPNRWIEPRWEQI